MTLTERNLRDALCVAQDALEHARELMWRYGFPENELQPIRLALAEADRALLHSPFVAKSR